MTTYVKELQPEFRVNYCKMITVSVDDRMNTSEVRTALAADWPFLMDPERRLLHELEMTDTTDLAHGEVYIPTSPGWLEFRCRDAPLARRLVGEVAPDRVVGDLDPPAQCSYLSTDLLQCLTHLRVGLRRSSANPRTRR